MTGSVLILGGTGFIGRHLAQYIVEQGLAAHVRIVDKVLPQTCWATSDQLSALDKCEFMQANLANPAAIAKVMDGHKWDYVFNCAGETRYGQPDAVYDEKVRDLSINCAKEAQKQGIRRFIELSTAQVYASDKRPCVEDSKLAPWTRVAKAKLEAEEALKKLDGLDVVILRPSVVYGLCDLSGITPRLVIAAVYKHLNTNMELLWTAGLHINTVHVIDVVRAMWHFRDSGGETFNVVDQSDSSMQTVNDLGKRVQGINLTYPPFYSAQESINILLDKIFHIKHLYLGTIMSKIAETMSMANLTEEVNEKHLEPWSQLCQAHEIENSPLTPYLDQELLYNNNLFVSGTKAGSNGFELKYPKMTEDLLREVVETYIHLGLFPKVL